MKCQECPARRDDKPGKCKAGINAYVQSSSGMLGCCCNKKQVMAYMQEEGFVITIGDSLRQSDEALAKAAVFPLSSMGEPCWVSGLTGCTGKSREEAVQMNLDYLSHPLEKSV